MGNWNSGVSVDYAKMAESMETANQRTNEGFWQPTSKNDKSIAVIRFMPIGDLSVFPIAERSVHFIEIGDKLEVVNCPKTFGFESQCPICEKSKKLYDTFGKECAEAGQLYKKKKYIANILVVDDPEKPENNGKIFLYEFGAKIYKKINDKLKPATKFETPVGVWDVNIGCNFKINITGTGKRTNYDSCEFMASSSLADTLTRSNIKLTMEEIESKVVDVRTFNKPESIKSYNEIKRIVTSYEEGKDTDVSSVSAVVTSAIDNQNESAPVSTPTAEENKNKDTDDIPF